MCCGVCEGAIDGDEVVPSGMCRRSSSMGAEAVARVSRAQVMRREDEMKSCEYRYELPREIEAASEANERSQTTRWDESEVARSCSREREWRFRLIIRGLRLKRIWSGFPLCETDYHGCALKP